MNQAIEIKNLSKRYADFYLDHVTFSLPAGAIMGLVGENGAGKSTIIQLIMNGINREDGDITVLDVDNQSPMFTQLKNDIGVVLDEAYFPEEMTSKQVNQIMKLTYQNWDEERFRVYLQRFALPEKKPFKQFSRGMRMKLAIAVALSHHPRLLILDEATSGLDPMVRDEILDIFNEFTRDETHSILLSSHIVSDLEKICDYIAFIHKGKLMFCEEKDRLLQEYAIAKLTPMEFEALPEQAVYGAKHGAFGVETLVRKNEIRQDVPIENTTLEDIILFLAKEDH